MSSDAALSGETGWLSWAACPGPAAPMPLCAPGAVVRSKESDVGDKHFYLDRPSTSLNEATASLVPDPLNYGWRDYGARVGIWRVIECLDRHGIRASALLNSDVCGRYPQIIDAGRDRSWACVAHGKTNSVLHAGMAAREERVLLAEVVGTIGAPGSAVGAKGDSLAGEGTTVVCWRPL